jgi:anti-sigma factor RsiW
MSTAPHPIAPEEIMAHLDGELSADRAQSVSAHIESCATCQELVTSLGHTSRSLTDWTVGSIPASLENSVTLSRANSRSPSRSAGSNWFPRTLRLRRKQWMGGLAAAAAAAALLLSVSVRTLDHRAKSASPEPSVLARLREQQAPAANSQPVDSARVNSAEEQQEGDRISSAYQSLAWSSAPAPSVSPQAAYEHKMLLSPITKNSALGPTLSAPMIARTVSLALIAKDFDASRASLDAILARHNGYSASLAVNTPQGAARTLQASLRIPAPQLPAALAELKSLGRVELETQSGEEVTQQHADLLARLKNSRETEQRLQAILTQRTGKISDVLEVEQEIARVRGEIEQMEAEQKNLEHRVGFATVDLKLSEEYKAKLDSPAPAISTLIHNAAVNGYRNVADTLLSIILFFAEYAPVLVFWLLVFSIPAWLVWRRWRHAVAV